MKQKGHQGNIINQNYMNACSNIYDMYQIH